MANENNGFLQRNIYKWIWNIDFTDVCSNTFTIYHPLQNYVREKTDLAKYEVIELCDDGYSGTNLNRPGMTKLLEMARRGQVSCIVVKNFSRFGRDYLTVSDYIDQIFSFLGIRFILVNDHYDSMACKGVTSGVDMAFRNVIYGYYFPSR